MKRVTKTVAILWICFASLLSVGCAKQNDATKENLDSPPLLEETVMQQPREWDDNLDVPAWQLNGDNEITFDWYINYSWYTTPWGENLVSKAITEDTGVSINFITPKGNEADKLNAMIAADTLPDIITLGWWEPQVDEMISRGMVYPLNELADLYDAYFWQVADENVVNWNLKEDGNLYYYPNSCFTPKDFEQRDDIGSNQTFLVRKDIYEALGCPDMSTPIGFANAIRQAVKLFPEVDGEPLIPIGAHVFNDSGCVSFDQYLQNFLAVPYEQNGKTYDRYTDPDYLCWLKTLRKLGSEGYLSRDIFIDQRTQMEEKLSNGRYFCMLFQRTDIEKQQKELAINHPERIYMAVDGPRNSEGDDPVLPGGGINGWTVTLISKNCEYPDRAIQLLSYFLSEYGQKMIYLGVEGITYDMIDGVPVVREEVKGLLRTDRAEYDKRYGADNAYWMLQDNVMQMNWREKDENVMTQLEEWTYPYTHYLGQYEVNFVSGTEEGEADTQIKKLWGQTLPKLLLAESDEAFDDIILQFRRKRISLGYEMCQKESTRQIQNNKKKLGITSEE